MTTYSINFHSSRSSFSASINVVFMHDWTKNVLTVHEIRTLSNWFPFQVGNTQLVNSARIKLEKFTLLFSLLSIQPTALVSSFLRPLPPLPSDALNFDSGIFSTCFQLRTLVQSSSTALPSPKCIWIIFYRQCATEGKCRFKPCRKEGWSVLRRIGDMQPWPFRFRLFILHFSFKTH